MFSEVLLDSLYHEVMKNIVVLMCGKTHTGKTTFGKELSNIIPKNVLIDNDTSARFLKQNYAVINSDSEVRSKRTPTDPDLRLLIPQLIYDYCLRNSYNVILTASHSRKTIREKQRQIARKNGAIFVIVFMKYSDEAIQSRIAKTLRSTEDVDDIPNFNKELERQNSFFEYPESPEADYFFTVEKEEDKEVVKNKILELVRKS